MGKANPNIVTKVVTANDANLHCFERFCRGTLTQPFSPATLKAIGAIATVALPVVGISGLATVILVDPLADNAIAATIITTTLAGMAFVFYLGVRAFNSRALIAHDKEKNSAA